MDRKKRKKGGSHHRKNNSNNSNNNTDAHQPNNKKSRSSVTSSSNTPKRKGGPVRYLQKQLSSGTHEEFNKGMQRLTVDYKKTLGLATRTNNPALLIALYQQVLRDVARQQASSTPKHPIQTSTGTQIQTAWNVMDFVLLREEIGDQLRNLLDSHKEKQHFIFQPKPTVLGFVFCNVWKKIRIGPHVNQKKELRKLGHTGCTHFPLSREQIESALMLVDSQRTIHRSSSSARRLTGKIHLDKKRQRKAKTTKDLSVKKCPLHEQIPVQIQNDLFPVLDYITRRNGWRSHFTTESNPPPLSSPAGWVLRATEDPDYLSALFVFTNDLTFKASRDHIAEFFNRQNFCVDIRLFPLGGNEHRPAMRVLIPSDRNTARNQLSTLLYSFAQENKARKENLLKQRATTSSDFPKNIQAKTLVSKKDQTLYPYLDDVLLPLSDTAFSLNKKNRSPKGWLLTMPNGEHAKTQRLAFLQVDSEDNRKILLRAFRQHGCFAKFDPGKKVTPPQQGIKILLPADHNTAKKLLVYVSETVFEATMHEAIKKNQLSLYVTNTKKSTGPRKISPHD